jgi:hypothetical protein
MSKTKFVITFVLLLIGLLPVAFLLTFMIFPFWSWFEGVTGIESFGHSGPADWCYVFDYIIIVMISTYILIRNYKRA